MFRANYSERVKPKHCQSGEVTMIKYTVICLNPNDANVGKAQTVVQRNTKATTARIN